MCVLIDRDFIFTKRKYLSDVSVGESPMKER